MKKKMIRKKEWRVKKNHQKKTVKEKTKIVIKKIAP